VIHQGSETTFKITAVSKEVTYPFIVKDLKFLTDDDRPSSNACVCTHRSLKLLTDDKVTLQRSQLKTYHIVLCNLRFN